MRALSDNDAFVRIVQWAKKDDGFRQIIVRLIKADDFQRNSILNTLMNDMAMQKMPSDLVEAISSLKDKNIGNEFLQYLIKEGMAEKSKKVILKDMSVFVLCATIIGGVIFGLYYYSNSLWKSTDNSLKSNVPLN